MADSLIYDMSISAGDIQEQPFLKKDMLFITDTSASGNYSTNQIMFETSQLSNNGKWCDYGTDAYLSFPLMLTATCALTTGGTAQPMNGCTDYLLALKNSNYNLIHSIQIEYGNSNVIQLTPFINQYLNFKLHTEQSYEDELINGSTINYAKDTSNAWRYDTAPNSCGRGISNNANANWKNGVASQFNGDQFNSGMRQRQSNYQAYNSSGTSQFNPLLSPVTGRESIYGVNNASVKTSGMNLIESTSAYKCYYFDAILRLRDLPFFNKLPLIRGAYIKITLTVNQCQFSVTKDANGLLDFNPASLSLTSGGTNPLMFSASSVPLVENVNGSTPLGTTALLEATAVSSGERGDSVAENFFVPCGSSLIPVSTTTLCSICIGKNYFPVHKDLPLNPLKTQCRLYVPAYTMAPLYENRYIELGQKTINYMELFQYPIYNVPPNQNFNYLITNGQAKMKRMIICPYIASTANGNENGGTPFSPLVSPFSTEPSTVSPHCIQNFNVALGGMNVYQQNISYGYEHFMNETTVYGVNGNKITGSLSGRISQLDWSNNMGYIVVDLSRRLPEDDNTSISVSINGNNGTAKALDLFVFIEFEKQIVIDLLSGKKLN